MNYRSIDNATKLIHAKSNILFGDFDLIVGVPRSGVLAGSLIALHLNVNFCDLESFCRNIPLSHGSRRPIKGEDFAYPQEAQRILVVDDSVDSGTSIENALNRIRAVENKGGSTIRSCAIYASAYGKTCVDFYLEEVSQPRVFEWNLFHRHNTQRYAFDIDGVLCRDPTKRENDDGKRYVEFLRTVDCSIVPTYNLGAIVTSRLNRYRGYTEEWLSNNGIRYDELYMLDGVSAQERRVKGLHSTFKANVYASLSDSVLFIESDPKQSRDIAKLTGKPVLSYEERLLINDASSFRGLQNNLRSRKDMVLDRLKAKIKASHRQG